MNLLAPFGFYGAGNIGDEATLQGFARLVAGCAPRQRVWVASRNPRHTRNVEPSFRYFQAEGRDWTRWLAEKRTKAVVFAGGTPIMDCLGKWPLSEVAPLVEDARRRGKPVVFAGIGTEGLHREESRRIVGEQLGAWTRQWTVRSQFDYERLVDYGVPAERIQVAADMAWLLNPASPDWGRQRLRDWGIDPHRRLLGVNLLAEKHVMAREPRLFAKLAEFLDLAIENHEAFVVFLSNEVREEATFDKAAAIGTLAAMRHRNQAFIAPNEYLAPQQMCSLIANCRATVSMRYHFCLFSALQTVPFLALKRSDKVADLCSDLEWPYGTGMNELTVAGLTELFDHMASHHASAPGRLSERTLKLRRRAYENTIAIDELHGRPLARIA
jgi:polysaccharide pyruvyl transferase WcaK-like protein